MSKHLSAEHRKLIEARVKKYLAAREAYLSTPVQQPWVKKFTDMQQARRDVESSAGEDVPALLAEIERLEQLLSNAVNEVADAMSAYSADMSEYELGGEDAPGHMLTTCGLLSTLLEGLKKH